MKDGKRKEPSDKNLGKNKKRMWDRNKAARIGERKTRTNRMKKARRMQGSQRHADRNGRKIERKKMTE